MKYLKPASLDEALKLLADEKTRYPILAGGTDLIVQMRDKQFSAKGLIDVSLLNELVTIVEAEEYIEIGALVTHRMIIDSKIIKSHFKILTEACETVGAIQIQNRGTIGGNIANASPAGDAPPVLVVLNCELELSSIYGRRWMRLIDFFEGYRKLNKAPEEMITRIRIPLPTEFNRIEFYKVGTRKAQAISKAAMCIGSKFLEGRIEKISIAAASMGPTVVAAPKTQDLLIGKALSEELIAEASQSLMKEWAPIDDVRSTAQYRSLVCGNLLAKFLKELSI